MKVIVYLVHVGTCFILLGGGGGHNYGMTGGMYEFGWGEHM